MVYINDITKAGLPYAECTNWGVSCQSQNLFTFTLKFLLLNMFENLVFHDCLVSIYTYYQRMGHQINTMAERIKAVETLHYYYYYLFYSVFRSTFGFYKRLHQHPIRSGLRRGSRLITLILCSALIGQFRNCMLFLTTSDS